MPTTNNSEFPGVGSARNTTIIIEFRDKNNNVDTTRRIINH